MNNIRKIIEERLGNAMNDYLLANNTTKIYLRGQIEAYQDCLNLFPAPRTEAELIKEFEKLGWKVYANNNEILWLELEGYGLIQIDKIDKSYKVTFAITIQEHKLLNELFICWGWL
jgi:hypothetical protein